MSPFIEPRVFGPSVTKTAFEMLLSTQFGWLMISGRLKKRHGRDKRHECSTSNASSRLTNQQENYRNSPIPPILIVLPQIR